MGGGDGDGGDAVDGDGDGGDAVDGVTYDGSTHRPKLVGERQVQVRLLVGGGGDLSACVVVMASARWAHPVRDGGASAAHGSLEIGHGHLPAEGVRQTQSTTQA